MARPESGVMTSAIGAIELRRGAGDPAAIGLTFRSRGRVSVDGVVEVVGDESVVP